MSGTYTVAVGSFEGPFDLLLQLIARRKMDIYDVSIAEITDDYLVVLRHMEAIDLDMTTEFLVVAATLVELKAARLLPVSTEADVDALALEARDLLYARLLEYRTFKRASAWLGERLGLYGGRYPRTAGPDPDQRRFVPPLAFTTSARQLAALAERVHAEQPGAPVDISHLQPVRMTVRQGADLVMDELARAGGRARFAELTAGCRHRIEIVVCFLAVLELYKEEHVEVEQGGCFGALTVTAVDLGGWWSDRTAGPGLVTSADRSD